MTQSRQQQLVFVLTIVFTCLDTSGSLEREQQQQQQQQQLSTSDDRGRRRPRHTPFLPGDYWNGNRPDFGPTDTDLKVVVNATARMKCPISHVADNRVSKKGFDPIIYRIA